MAGQPVHVAPSSPRLHLFLRFYSPLAAAGGIFARRAQTPYSGSPSVYFSLYKPTRTVFTSAGERMCVSSTTTCRFFRTRVHAKAGKLRGSEVLVFRRELIDSRRELIEAAADAWLAQIELGLATGATPVPPTSDLPRSSETSR